MSARGSCRAPHFLHAFGPRRLVRRRDGEPRLRQTPRRPSHRRSCEKRLAFVRVGAMHTLLLLRHAKSSWEDRALPDFEHPLAPRGVRDAKRIGKHLRGLDVAPELVFCSSRRALGRRSSSSGRRSPGCRFSWRMGSTAPRAKRCSRVSAQSRTRSAVCFSWATTPACRSSPSLSPRAEPISSASRRSSRQPRWPCSPFHPGASWAGATPSSWPTSFPSNSAEPVPPLGLSRTPWPIATPTEPRRNTRRRSPHPRIEADVAAPTNSDNDGGRDEWSELVPSPTP